MLPGYFAHRLFDLFFSHSPGFYIPFSVMSGDAQ
jgi:hypothetical protein